MASAPALLPASLAAAAPERRAGRGRARAAGLARMAGGGGILAFLLWRLGTGPFLGGLRAIDARALALACGIGLLTTVSCAWRWSLVARGLGVRLPVGTAVAAYYRSQFYNTVLPGGVLGDVHRAVWHGRNVGDVGRGVRAVVLERLAGQVVQAAIALVVLFALPSPVRPYMPVVAAVAAGVVAVAGLCLTGRARAVRAAAAELRGALVARRNWVGIALASAVIVAGHVATFVVAALLAASCTPGTTVPVARLVPLALLALLAMGLPLNIGGWGPREGVAAWAFGGAGLSATLGVSAAVVYGVLVFAACLPGAAVPLLGWVGRVRRDGRGRGDTPESGQRLGSGRRLESGDRRGEP